jgi:hypothetical protein
LGKKPKPTNKKQNKQNQKKKKKKEKHKKQKKTKKQTNKQTNKNIYIYPSKKKKTSYRRKLYIRNVAVSGSFSRICLSYVNKHLAKM